jgi:hypothetical protein
MDEFDWAKSQIRQMRHTDNQVAAFRAYYEERTPEERAKVKSWLERAEALEDEGRALSLFPKINMQREENDESITDEMLEQGCELPWADATLKPHTMLDAIRAWDKGEIFVPRNIDHCC